MEKVIKVECRGADSAPLSAFNELQGELKTLSNNDYEALREEIIEQGFSFPLNVWIDPEGVLWLLDGHQRIRALKKMADEGWSVGALPYSTVSADSREQAKKKLLAAASQYGKVTEIGLANFLKDVNIDPVKLASHYPLPGLNMPKFIELHLPKVHSIQVSSVDDGDVGSIPGTQITASQARAQGEVSHVRVVQLFFDEGGFNEFMEKSNKLQQRFNSANLSDTMMEVVREGYNLSFPEQS